MMAELGDDLSNSGNCLGECGRMMANERSLLAAFVQQEIVAGCDQGRWQREIIVGSVMQREITASRDQIVAGRDQGRWLREIVTSSVCATRDRCWLRPRKMAVRDRCWQCCQEIAVAMTKEDGSERSLMAAMRAVVEGIKGDLVAERLVDRRLKAVILGLNRLMFRVWFGLWFGGVLGL
ncbi:hypothetical protein BHM03_00021974 [Ensete ventricosum]|nr:hypothetical protein BHM03_00021974 [Ensete ventricosum]